MALFALFYIAIGVLFASIGFNMIKQTRERGCEPIAVLGGVFWPATTVFLCCWVFARLCSRLTAKPTTWLLRAMGSKKV